MWAKLFSGGVLDDDDHAAAVWTEDVPLTPVNTAEPVFTAEDIRAAASDFYTTPEPPKPETEEERNARIWSEVMRSATS